MSRQIQIRRGSAAEHENFTGAIGEVTMDTTNKTLRVHDGEMVGGNELMSLNKFYSNMTNCLTEIPQNIKLELSSGTLQLKSGSKVYIPSGKRSATSSTIMKNRNYMAYNGNIYIAIGNNGSFSYSYDGITWTTGTNIGSNLSWTSVVWMGTQFVALSNLGWRITSSDGLTWSGLTQNQSWYDNSSTYSWFDSAFDGTKIVMIANTGWITTSTDGANWTNATQITNLGNQTWVSIFWDGTRFIALSQNGYISTSSDGLTWAVAVQYQNLASVGYWRQIAFDGTKYVAINKQGYISTSTDLTDWTAATYYSDLGNRTWNYILYDGTKFMVLAGTNGYYATSVNGTTWGGLIFNNSTLSSDVTVDAQTATGQAMVFYDYVSGTARCDVLMANCKSGTSPTSNSIYYHTNNNKIDFYNASDVASGKTYSFPLAIVTVSSGSITSIDRIFNGIGYIGNSIFDLPGIKGVIPNGRNNDGGLNNNIFETTDICVVNFSASYTANNVPIGITSSTIGYDFGYKYNSTTNMNTGNYSIIGSVNVSSGKITDFKIKTVFNAVDYYDFEKLENNIANIDNINNIVTTTASNKSSRGYFKFNNGLIVQWGNEPVVASGEVSITFPVAFSSSNSYAIVKNYGSGQISNATDHEVSFYNLTSTTATTYNAYGYSDNYQWIAIGY